MPTVYLRDETDRKYVTDQVNPECQWVLDGEGVPTRKFDGTCVMLDEHGQWWARREVKQGKTEPEGYQEVQYDHVTGKRVGWVPMSPQGFMHPLAEALGIEGKPEDLEAAIAEATDGSYLPGTYELVGPKINGNPDRFDKHTLVEHGYVKPTIHGQQPTVKELVAFVASSFGWEGIVWHHPDGRMAKLKGRDLR